LLQSRQRSTAERQETLLSEPLADNDISRSLDRDVDRVDVGQIPLGEPGTGGIIESSQSPQIPTVSSGIPEDMESLVEIGIDPVREHPTDGVQPTSSITRL
jgi:hypothetical protein